MASIAVLPILIGLAVDYAIQFQARYDEAVEIGLAGADAARGRLRRRPDDRHRLPGDRGRLPRPPALPDADGPRLRLLLVVGIAIAFVLALTAGFAALSPAGGAWVPAPRAGLAGASSAAVPAARARQDAARSERLLSLAVATLSGAGPGRRAGPGRHGLGRRDSDRNRRPTSASWRRRTSRRSKDLNELQDTTGVSGELDVSIEAADLTDPATIEWMAGFKQRVLEAAGSRAKTRAA